MEASLEIQEYSPVASALAELRGRLANVVHDVKTTAGMDAARKDRAEVRGLRVALEDKRKEIKAPALERCKLIDEEAKRITAALRELEDPIDAQIKAEEQRKEAEKAAKAEAERQRVAVIRERINGISREVVESVGKTAEVIAASITVLELLAIDEVLFAEFAGEADGVKQSTLAKLRDMHAAAEAQEAEAKRLAEQRAELARLEMEAAERRAAERKAQEEEAARVKAEQDAAAAKLKAEREEFERQQAEALRKSDEDRAEAGRKAAAEREEADRIAREARQAEERRLAADRAELDRQRQEQKARESAEREKREAEEAEARRKIEADEQARQHRARVAAMVPPTAEEIVQLVADHYALGDYDTAAGWLAKTIFPLTPAQAESVA